MTISLERRITASLIVAALITGFVGASVASVFHYVDAADEQDEQLKLINNLLTSSGGRVTSVAVPDEDDPDADILIVKPGDNLRLKKNFVVAVPQTVVSGFSDIELNGQHWRSYANNVSDPTPLVVLQRRSVRTAAAIEGAITAGVPILVSIFAILLVMRISIVRTFATVRALGERIGNGKLPVEGDIAMLPTEIRPFVQEVVKASHYQRELLGDRARFVGNVAHELRSPLAALTVQIDNVATVELSEEARARINLVRGGLRRTADLLQQLLDLSRLQEQGNKDLSEVDVSEVISEVIEHALPHATGRSIEIRVNRLDTIKFKGSRVALFSLLRNAIDNAIRYSPAHSVVEVSAISAQDTFVIGISDQGPGMDEADLDRAFEPFFRASANRDETGSGLGLSIVAEAARELGGSALLRRRRQRGLSFEYHQPAEAEPT